MTTKAELERKITLKCVQCPDVCIIAGQLHCTRKKCRLQTVRRWLDALKRLEAQTRGAKEGQ
jgi:hypothetical protein